MKSILFCYIENHIQILHHLKIVYNREYFFVYHDQSFNWVLIEFRLDVQQQKQQREVSIPLCCRQANCNHILFSELSWQGNSEGNFRSSSQAATCPPVYHTQWSR